MNLGTLLDALTGSEVILLFDVLPISILKSDYQALSKLNKGMDKEDILVMLQLFGPSGEIH